MKRRLPSSTRLKDRGMLSRKDPRKDETCLRDRVTHIRIRDCLLIPIACSVRSVAPRCRGDAMAARPLSRLSAAHKHANEDIHRVYTRGPAGLVEANVS